MQEPYHLAADHRHIGLGCTEALLALKLEAEVVGIDGAVFIVGYLFYIPDVILPEDGLKLFNGLIVADLVTR
jgi:hypothetical protein